MRIANDLETLKLTEKQLSMTMLKNLMPIQLLHRDIISWKFHL